MTMDRLQRIVWLFLPILGLLIMLVGFGARGGVWAVIPISLMGVIIAAFYLMYLRASAHERRDRADN